VASVQNCQPKSRLIQAPGGTMPAYKESYMKKKPIRILMVEDNRDDAELIQLALPKNGSAFEIQRVETEQHYVRALKLRPPDLILSDHALPGFDGFTALRCCAACDVLGNPSASSLDFDIGSNSSNTAEVFSYQILVGNPHTELRFNKADDIQHTQ